MIYTNFKKRVTIVLFISISISLWSQTSCLEPSENESFSFCIEQDGQIIEIDHNTVELKKGPFTLILLIRKPMGILVNGSRDETLYKGFIKHKPLERILETPDLFMGIGEAPGNPDELLLLDKVSPHYLYYDDGASHRFSETEQRGDLIICRRNISNYTTYADSFHPIPIGDLESDVIYLSFMYLEYDENYNRNEKQSDAVKIVFTEN